MRWFSTEAGRRVERLSEAISDAYIERSQLTFELLSLEPNLTDLEMAASWAAVAVVMLEAEAASDSPEAIMVSQVTRHFFDSYCQSYIENLCHSDLRLDLASELIQANISPVLDGMPPERLERVISLGSRFSATAVRLASSTIHVLNANFDENQAKLAATHSAAIVAKRVGLNPFERAKALEWLGEFNWRVLY